MCAAVLGVLTHLHELPEAHRTHKKTKHTQSKANIFLPTCGVPLVITPYHTSLTHVEPDLAGYQCLLFQNNSQC